MTATVHSISPDGPTVDHRHRLQLLIDAACEIHHDPAPDVITAIRERLRSHLSGDLLELHALLLAAAWRDSSHLNLLVQDLADAEHTVQQHALTEHDQCCSGECRCVGRMARCGDCEDGPALRRDERLRELLWFLTQTVGASAVDTLVGRVS